MKTSLLSTTALMTAVLFAPLAALAGGDASAQGKEAGIYVTDGGTDVVAERPADKGDAGGKAVEGSGDGDHSGGGDGAGGGEHSGGDGSGDGDHSGGEHSGGDGDHAGGGEGSGGGDHSGGGEGSGGGEAVSESAGIR